MGKLVTRGSWKGAEFPDASAEDVCVGVHCGIPDRFGPGKRKADWSVEFKQEA